MRKILPIILLAITYPIGELYQFYDNAYYDNKGASSWILDGSHPMLTSWNIKYVSEGVNWIIVMIAACLISAKPTRITKLALIEYLLYRVIDMCAYFNNFKTANYWYIYLTFGIVIALLYLKNHATRDEKTNNIR